MINTLIPGVYTSYELSGIRYSGKSAGVAGIIWRGESDEADVTTFTGSSQIAAAYGTESTIFRLGKLLFANGAMTVKAIQISSDYTYGFYMMMDESDVTVMVCDSTEDTVHTEMSTAIFDGGEDTKYRIGIVASGKSVEEMVLEAEALNSERMVLVPDLQCAAALGGVILGSTDPSVPFNGAALEGIEREYTYTEEEINTLLKGGVTPIRTIGGQCEIVRAVTTKTTTDGTYDSTWRDLNTILITDYVIPQVRSALRIMFTRAKNTERTRGAVRTQVIIELEKMRDRGIIESYGNVTAKKSTSDPAVCEVGFEFTVAGGMHQIIIAAGIIV